MREEVNADDYEIKLLARQCFPPTLVCSVYTLVDQLKLRDDVKPDVGELVLEHGKEHGQEVLNSSKKRQSAYGLVR